MTTFHDSAYTTVNHDFPDIALPTYSVGDLLVLGFTSGVGAVDISGWSRNQWGYIRVADGSESDISVADWNPSSTSYAAVWVASSWTPTSGYIWSWSSWVEGQAFSYYGTNGDGSGTPVPISGSDGFSSTSLVTHVLFGWLFDVGSTAAADLGLPFPYATFDAATGSPTPTVQDTFTTGSINFDQTNIETVLADVVDLAGDYGAWNFAVDWTFPPGGASGGPTATLIGIPLILSPRTEGGGGGSGGGGGGGGGRGPAPQVDGYWGILVN